MGSRERDEPGRKTTMHRKAFKHLVVTVGAGGRVIDGHRHSSRGEAGSHSRLSHREQHDPAQK
jgi:hypothetical protein